MCGIVGYIGDREAQPILLSGLCRLEYRGYDSAGIAVLNQKGEMSLAKSKGRLASLEKKLKAAALPGTVGIGHTRWATHGEPSETNCHPHTNGKRTVSVIHNGIIENYQHLREFLIGKGYHFYSETDTEVIPNLIDYYYSGDLLEAVMKTVSKLEGSYALGILSVYEPDRLIAVRKDSPLVIGVGRGENFIASDVPAVLNYTRDFIYLGDKEFAVIRKDSVEVYTPEGERAEKPVKHVTWNADAAEKGGYEHFMLKEICEQPGAIKATMTSRILPGQPVRLDDISFTEREIKDIEKIYIVACGTAYHAGIVGKYVIEKLARIPVEVDIASEFRYRDPLLTDKMLLIVVSQSGETADTLAALREAKSRGVKVLAVTNVVGSSVAREADDVLYTWAGPEIAVASTKAYTTQLIAMYILALYFAQHRGTMTNEEMETMKSDMLTLPQKAEQMLDHRETLQKFASNNYMHRNMFFLGRGIDYAVAMEGALKLKEISYIHSEAYAGGELKHGTIALIEDGTVVIALATQSGLYDKMISNIREVTTRGANVLGLAMEGNTGIEKVAEAALYIPAVQDVLAPVLAVIPLQLLAYYTAVQKGCDVDKPRNLAKSVTVE
ncbi:glutamine--fructose-6-phosphate transaminase (isomerizing) [Caproiciproducens sp. NJN-50]|uniref:glutamine--fructose-6-phosphate transaminase (isomerizing) n=1 Tax=Acutalibacteraceae TaxID=3082771 RepID=UPI000FFE0836|nr:MULTISPECIES: glutamine--fructose-6-phosphate transaminase (isomerizing) [Acutalibacteraceae]QAT49055.1 glutamine--fructose-6-phosphate transaminase (isomerizing) [Caproiciproducens sp. NJN-50]